MQHCTADVWPSNCLHGKTQQDHRPIHQFLHQIRALHMVFARRPVHQIPKNIPWGLDGPAGLKTPGKTHPKAIFNSKSCSSCLSAGHGRQPRIPSSFPQSLECPFMWHSEHNGAVDARAVFSHSHIYTSRMTHCYHSLTYMLVKPALYARLIPGRPCLCQYLSSTT